MDTERTATEAFGLRSDETRLDILRTVAEAQNEDRESGIAELSFSEVYDRADVDGTSELSYHLGELTGTFLRKHGEGYAFTHAGEQMAGSSSRGTTASCPTSARLRPMEAACAVAKPGYRQSSGTSTSRSSVRTVSGRPSHTGSHPPRCVATPRRIWSTR